MRITVINGTEKHGVTYGLKEIFLDELRDQAEITEFYLPKDCPNFCIGCITCFHGDERGCKDAKYTQKIEKALLDASQARKGNVRQACGYHHAVSGCRGKICGKRYQRQSFMVGCQRYQGMQL